LFHEHCYGDTGQGLGAAHQTGWTALIATLLDQCGRHRHPAPYAEQHEHAVIG
jgi:hypothetical protein